MRQADYFTKTIKIISHLLVWGLLFWLPFLVYVPYSIRAHGIQANTQIGWRGLYLCASILWVTIFYVNANFLIPKFARAKSIWPYSIVQLFYVLALCSIVPLLYWAFLEIKSPEYHNVNSFSVVSILTYLLILAGSTAYHFIKRNNVRSGKTAAHSEAEIFKRAATTAREPVNPLYIYKSLKNISSSAQKNIHEITPSSLKLFSLANYLSQQEANARVPLETEIDHLKTYVELLRQDFTHHIIVTVSSEIVNGQFDIRPLQLIYFVENTFIYGDGINENTVVDISLNNRKKMLLLTIKTAPRQNPEKPTGNYPQPGLIHIRRKLLVNCFQNL
jgi:hypothetical protein